MPIEEIRENLLVLRQEYFKELELEKNNRDITVSKVSASVILTLLLVA